MKQTLLTICLILFALPSWGEDNKSYGIFDILKNSNIEQKDEDIKIFKIKKQENEKPIFEFKSLNPFLEEDKILSCTGGVRFRRKEGFFGQKTYQYKNEKAGINEWGVYRGLLMGENYKLKKLTCEAKEMAYVCHYEVYDSKDKQLTKAIEIADFKKEKHIIKYDSQNKPVTHNCIVY